MCSRKQRLIKQVPISFLRENYISFPQKVSAYIKINLGVVPGIFLHYLWYSYNLITYFKFFCRLFFSEGINLFGWNLTFLYLSSTSISPSPELRVCISKRFDLHAFVLLQCLQIASLVLLFPQSSLSCLPTYLTVTAPSFRFHSLKSLRN